MKTVMKQLSIAVLSFLLVISTMLTVRGGTVSAATDQTSLKITNAGFEDPVTGGAIPGWRQTMGKSGGFTIDNSFAFEGTSSLKLIDPSNVDNYGLLSDKIAIHGGDSITVTESVYITQGTPGMYLYFYDSGGKQIKTYSKGFDTSPKGQWTNVSLEGLAPNTAVQMEILLYSGGGNVTTVNFDRIQATAISSNPPSDGFLNPGFEQVVTNGVIPGWKQTIGVGGITVSDEKSYSETHSLKIQDTSTGTAYGLLSNRIKAIGGEMYRIYANLYMDSGTNGMFLYFYDAQGKQIKTYSKGFDALPKKEWGTAVLEGIAPDEAVEMEILLYSGAGNTGVGYFDNLRFVHERQLDVKFGAPIDHGPMVKIAQSPRAVLGTNANGEDFLSFVINGAPATFYAVGAYSGDILFSQKMTGLDTVWAITKGSDGNIYFSGTSTGVLYRYLPNEKRIESLGVNPTPDRLVWSLKASNDGKIYGGTYPGAHLFEYDIALGTFRDFGAMKEGQNYTRGVGVSDNYVYAGIGTTAYVSQVNRKTGEIRDIEIPNRGQTGTIADIEFYKGYAIIRGSIDRFYVLNEESGQVVDTITGIHDHFSPPSPYNADLVYFRQDNDIYTYNWSTRATEKVESIPKQTEVYGNILLDWVTMKVGEKAGKKVLVGMNGDSSFFLYDPEDHWYQMYKPNVESQPVNLRSLQGTPDGKLYVGAIYKGMSLFNPETNQIEYEETGIPQVEGVGFLNGKDYFGTYPGAYIYQFDPAKPTEFKNDPSGNPGKIYEIGEFQDRPHSFASGDGKLFVGTLPGYGGLGGALSIYNDQDGSWEVYRNVVKDQTIIGMEYKDGLLYGGTYVWGGLGIEPTETEGKIFVWDVKQKKKIAEFTPDIPGLEKKPKTVGKLKFGPDGLLWGAADGAVFALNPVTYEVVKSKVIYDHLATYPIDLEFGADGLLYTTVGVNLTAVNPKTLDYKMLVENVHEMTLAPDGSIYYLTGYNASHLFQLPVGLGSAKISSALTLIPVGGSSQLEITEAKLANGNPANLSRAKVTYTSSNPAVAAIVDGQIKGISEGIAAISAVVEVDGSKVTTDSIQIQVQNSLESVTLSVYSTEMKRSDTVKLNLAGILNNGEPADLQNAGIEYFSSNPQTVAIENGLAVAYNAGNANVYAKVTLNGTVVDSNTITLTVRDTLPPVSHAALEDGGAQPVNGWYHAAITLKLTAEDDFSGVALTEFRVNNGSWVPYVDSVRFDRDGEYTIDYRSTDRVGNQEAIQAVSFNIDLSAPVIQQPAAFEFMQTDAITATIPVTDALSGVKEITAMLDGQPTPYPLNLPPLILPVGDHSLRIRAVDNAGNAAEAEITLKVTIDLSHFADLILNWAQTTTGHNFPDSLLAKVHSVLKAAENSRNPNSDRVIVNILNALEQEIKAQSGKKMTKEFAELLLQDIQYLRNQYSQ